MQLQDTAHVTPDDLTRVLGLLKASFTHMIIDLSKSYTALDMVALKSAKDVLLVTQLDLPCLRNVVRLMLSFDEDEGLKDKIKIVVNRVGLDSGAISLKKAQETMGREIFWQLPNDYKTMVEVRNNGVPLIEQAPRAGITQALARPRRKASPAKKPKTDGPLPPPAPNPPAAAGSASSAAARAKK